MNNKFTMELVWHNCKTYPPKEEYNDCLCMSNGNYITKVKYHRKYGWLDKESGIVIQDGDLYKYWWADIKQTVQGEPRFKE